MGRTIGYARVSTQEQNLDRQLRAFNEYGCDIIYQEKASGTKLDRPELNKMLDSLVAGDTVLVAEITRFSRSTVDLINIVNRITAVGASIKSFKDTWLDTTSAQGKFLLTVFAGISQYERDNMVERINDGIKTAQANGVHCGRPFSKSEALETALALYLSGSMSVEDIIAETGVARATLYRKIKREGK